MPFSPRLLTALWQRLRLPVPAELLAGTCDLFHSPDFTLPPLARARGLVTVHDLSFMRLPQCADPRLRSYLSAAVPRSVARAARVLADSFSTAGDLVELLGVDPDRISVVPGGVDERFRRVDDASQLQHVRVRYNLPEQFILAVGTLEPRKDFPTLISAFARLIRKARLPHHLVIAGREGWMFEPIYERIRQEALGERVHLLGFVEDEHLPALYTLAGVLAFPSLYEGFGLPPLEALACGTPVVAARSSSVPEAVGDAALLVPPGSVDELVDALHAVLLDEALRAALVKKGPAQVARYRWPAAALLLLDAYTRAGNQEA